MVNSWLNKLLISLKPYHQVHVAYHRHLVALVVLAVPDLTGWRGFLTPNRCSYYFLFPVYIQIYDCIFMMCCFSRLRIVDAVTPSVNTLASVLSN